MTLMRRTPNYDSVIGKHGGGERDKAVNTTINSSAAISAVATVQRLYPSIKLLLAYSKCSLMAMATAT